MGGYHRRRWSHGKTTSSLGSVSRDSFSHALQFLKRRFLQSPDILFIYLFQAETSVLACTSATLGELCLCGVPVPGSSHGPSGGKDHCGLPHSQFPHLLPKMYTDFHVLCVLPNAPCPGDVYIFSLVDCHLVGLPEVAKRNTCLSQRFEGG